MTGVSTGNFHKVALIDSVLGNRNGSSSQISFDHLVAQFLAQLGPHVETLADLQNDAGWPRGAVAFVWSGTEAQKGVYRQTVGFRADAWKRVGDLPAQIARDRGQHTGSQDVQRCDRLDA